MQDALEFLKVGQASCLSSENKSETGRMPVPQNGLVCDAFLLPAVANGAQYDYTLPSDHYRYKTYYTVIPLRNVIWQ